MLGPTALGRTEAGAAVPCRLGDGGHSKPLEGHIPEWPCVSSAPRFRVTHPQYVPQNWKGLKATRKCAHGKAAEDVPTAARSTGPAEPLSEGSILPWSPNGPSPIHELPTKRYSN